MKYFNEKESGFNYIENFKASDYPTILILHGYGANARDLATIADIAEFEALNFNWIFLEAPLSPPELQLFNGKAWFDVDIAYFQNLVKENKFDEYYARTPENISYLHDSIEIFLKKKSIGEDQLIIGGFSQGAMVATDYLYEKKLRPMALIHLSGTVIREELWKSQTLEDLKIFQSHGRYDEVLPVQGAMHFKEIAKSKDHKLHIFEGGHELPPQILFQLYNFLKPLQTM